MKTRARKTCRAKRKNSTIEQRLSTDSVSSTPVHNGVGETVLFAVSGMSPAVVTETIWALATEKPPIIVDRVIVVTTAIGKQKFESELFQPSEFYGGLTVWQALRKHILGDAYKDDSRINLDPILVISRREPTSGRSYPLEDIRTPADNEAAADFILEELRKLTENPEIRVIASLAGGRKTMGALLYAAISLLGRPQDRLTHVLVSEPFDNPALMPKFYFPSVPGVLHVDPQTGATYSDEMATLWLADVPFVRLRTLFGEKLGKNPGSFTNLVRTCARLLDNMGPAPEVALKPSSCEVVINGQPVHLSPREFALFAFLADRCAKGEPPLEKQAAAVNELQKWLATCGKSVLRDPGLYQDISAAWSNAIDTEELRGILCRIRKKFVAAGLGILEPHLLPRKGAFGINIKLLPAQG